MEETNHDTELFQKLTHFVDFAESKGVFENIEKRSPILCYNVTSNWNITQQAKVMISS